MFENDSRTQLPSRRVAKSIRIFANQVNVKRIA